MSQKHSSNHAIVFALEGELGAGKTTFVQKFAKACGITEPVLSPTFVILKKYGNLIHIDAYRITGKDLLAFGIEEIFKNPKNIVMIEWADRVRDILPKDRITIKFDHVDANTRKIQITSTKTQTITNESNSK